MWNFQIFPMGTLTLENIENAGIALTSYIINIHWLPPLVATTMVPDYSPLVGTFFGPPYIARVIHVQCRATATWLVLGF